MKEILDFIIESFNDEFQNAMTGDRIASAIIVSLLLSLFIVLVYKLSFLGVAYSKSFAFSLILISMVTSVIIMTVTTNLALSLGMVGALSIVRFRTAVKETYDTVYLFWAIAAGIMAGAGLIFTAVITNVLLGLVYLLVYYFSKKIKNKPYLLIVRYKPDSDKSVEDAISTIKNKKIKSRTVSGSITELALSVNIKPEDIHIVDKISQIEGVITASLVSYNGETTM